MGQFELTAKSQMYLDNGQILQKGEKVNIRVNSPGVQGYNIFSTPERRSSAVKQFAAQGIDLKETSAFLNSGKWEIKELPEWVKK